MKKVVSIVLISLFALSNLTNAQQKAVNSVKYMVTYDEAKAIYTAWLVPNYNTPNFNNPDSEEKGATAQFSLKVPQGFEMKNFQNLKGEWDKNAAKIGSESYFKDAGLVSNSEYYIIGKTPSETNYGVFKDGEPVALFTFQGNATDPKSVDVLENDDEFVDLSYNKLSLNVSSSFYSRSGQTAKMEAKPLEQFTKKTSLKDVVETLSEKLGATESQLLQEEDPSKKLLIYPNPSDSIVHIKYFSLTEGSQAKIELVDQKGAVLQDSSEETVRGFNTATVDISDYSGSMYFAKISIDNRVVSGKIIKK